METFFKRGQTCHDRERRESAVERYLVSGQTWVDTHPASPKVGQSPILSTETIFSGKAASHQVYFFQNL
jgi:hypothetical protein